MEFEYQGHMYPVEEIHVGDVKAGDAVIHDGEMKTVSGTDIRQDSFMGPSIFGDNYRSGTKPVLRVQVEYANKELRSCSSPRAE